MRTLPGYDHAGRRIQKTEGGITTNYLYNGDALHAEYGPAWGNPQAVHVQAGIDRPLARLTGTTNLPTATAAYYHADGLGSVLAATDAARAVTATQRFDAFGIKLGGLGTIPAYGYTGREPDATGLVYYRARYYDPSLGRFISRDPIGLAGGVNRYAYVGNNPVNFNDPNGLAARAVSNLWDARQSYYNFLADPQTALGVAEGAAGTALFGGSAGGGAILALPSGGTSAIPATEGMVLGSGLILDAGRRLVNSAAQNIYHNEASGGSGEGNNSSQTSPQSSGQPAPGKTTVYQSLDNTGNVNYVGITDNFARRAAAHLSEKGISIRQIDSLENISRSDARAVEQVLIETYGLGKNSGTLLNKINSISVQNPIYSNAIEQGQAILKTIWGN